MLHWEVPILTRREQLGTDDASLEKAGKEKKGDMGDKTKKAKQEKGDKTKTKQEKGDKTKTTEHDKAKEKPARQRRQLKEEAGGENREPPRPALKRPAAAPKAKAESVKTIRKQKTASVEKADSKGKNSRNAKTDPVEKKEDDKKESKTWAGRWIPTSDPQRKRFMAIKSVYDESLAKKIRRQSYFATVFFKTCSVAFHDRGLTDESTYEDFVGVAEECVSSFLTSEAVRNSTYSSKTLFNMLWYFF